MEQMAATDSLLQLWAKWRREPPEAYYPLLFHMLDVAMVTQEMWRSCLQSGARGFLSKQLDLSEEETCSWISFWAGLHDIGKASPVFQGKSDAARQRLRQSFDFTGGKRDITPGHGIISATVLPDLLKQHISDGDLCERVATVLGGHHGVFPTSGDILPIKDALRYVGGKPWTKARNELFTEISRMSGIEGLPSPRNPQSHPFLMFLAGLTSVADWIASNEDFFPCDRWQSQTHESHLDIAHKQAVAAIQRLGWAGWSPASQSCNFTGLFPDIEMPRPLQHKVAEMAESLGNSPGMVIIEAPMGEGKTETAMFLADWWATKLGQRGCYFALPTQATSNQMFGRVKKFLEQRYQGKLLTLMLLHGYASLSAEFNALLAKGEPPFKLQEVFGERGYDGAETCVVASEWFTYHKRGLLAPFGVGTIDQVLLAVLQTRHVFVRLFGLAHKTVIIDEVHAYDAYMLRLLERLLEWLASLNCSVVLLSATLPGERREQLLSAYARGRNFTPELQDVPYPRISWVSQQGSCAKHVAASKETTRTLHIKWLDGSLPSRDEDFSLGRHLQKALAKGGCAAVICNTVKQAQDIYCALKSYFPVQDAGDGYPELDLFHARYLFGERDQREKRTLCRFGKAGTKIACGDGVMLEVNRPRRAVVVATQVIEQSLDLDFDLMVSEMAPVDLLLQRAGRLWRHKGGDRHSITERPALWICCPEEDDKGLPQFSKSNEYIYEPHILLRSWLALMGILDIRIPEDVERLIESVYDARECPTDSAQSLSGLQERWDKSLEKLRSKRSHYTNKAKTHSILPPSYADDILEDHNFDLEEDNPEIHESLQALTRLSDPSVSLICLYGTLESPYLDAEHKQPIDIMKCPDRSGVKDLLKRSVTISNRELVSAIRQKTFMAETFKRNALLRHHCMLFFDDEGRNSIGKFDICLNPELGVIIEQK